jgi:hypothetical protein
MTDPDSLRARIAGLPPGAHAALDVLRRDLVRG